MIRAPRYRQAAARRGVLGLVVAVALCVVGGCREVAEYAPPDSAPTPDASRETAEEGQASAQSPPLSPVDDVTEREPEPPLDEPPAPADEPARSELADASPPASTPPAQEPDGFDNLFGPLPDAPAEQEEDAQDGAEPGDDQLADAQSDPFTDDPLPPMPEADPAEAAESTAEETPPPLWRDGDANGDDGFDTLFSDVAPEKSDATDEQPTTDALPDPPADQEPSATPDEQPPSNPETELPALPESPPDEPGDPTGPVPSADPAPPEAPAPADGGGLEWLDSLPERRDIEATAPAPPPEDAAPAAPTLDLDIDNTRRLAWLLGAKYSLAVVAQPNGSDQQQNWTPTALAELLGVDPPPPPDGAQGDEALTHLVKSARRMGDDLAARHGRDHAALLEIALKTNALAAAYERRPELAAPVASAVERAAPHTELHPALWTEFLDLLASDPTPDQVRRSVFSLHGAVERALRESP